MGRLIDGNFPELARRDHAPFKVGKDEDQHHKQIYHANSYVDFFLSKVRDQCEVLTDEQFAFYKDIDRVLKKKADFIEQHVDRRIQLFFMQLISVYRMPYHFEWVEAQDEFGKGGNYKLEHGGGEITFQTEAAHSSTLPSLVAYPRDEWESFQRGGRDKPKGFVYLKYGHSYMQHNATMELARCVNRADCLIDGTHKNSKLRNRAIRIVNAVAEGKYDPRKGTKLFMRQLDRFIRSEHAKLKAEDPRGKVLAQYLDRVEDVRPEINSDEGYFDTLLGLNLEHPRENVLRRVVYQRRFKLIQNCEAIEGKIARAILKAQNQMTKRRAKSLKNVDYRLRYVLLEEADPRLKRILERLFCVSLDQLRAGFSLNSERLRRFEKKERITAFRTQNAREIEKLKRTLRRYFRELNNEELNYRSHLFKGLRWDLNGWKQEEFSEKYLAKYDDAMSQSTVSRMEQRARKTDPNKVYATPLSQRRKDIGEEKALRIADIYDVDPGLFLPGILSSRY